ncbi:PQQ-binding-like beta-propeller repeat protein [Kitasatospora sp. LaBMicrA B282]|uniref:outer membrane protein assembly factor BamB family protein n=1 Tax=Kitasatospora sp. LaBMicrA B282 TaxID=3420949 RepID=UPI003D10C7D1
MLSDAIPVTVRGGSGCWTVTTPHVPLGRPVVDGDRVLVLIDGRLVALDTASGNPHFQSPHRIGRIAHAWNLSPHVLGDRVVVVHQESVRRGGGPVTFTLLDADDGALVRRLTVEAADRYELAPGALITWLATSESEDLVTAHDPADGRLLWSRSCPRIRQAQAIAGLLVLWTWRKSPDLIALDPRTGEPCWTARRTLARRTFGRADASPWLDGELVRPVRSAGTEDDAAIFFWSQADVAGTTGNTLGLLEARTGKVRGSVSAPRGNRYHHYEASLLEGGRTPCVYSCGNGRWLHLLRPFEPETPVRSLRLFPYRISSGPCRIDAADGRLYLRVDGGLLSAPLNEPGPLRRCPGYPRSLRARRPGPQLVSGPHHTYVSHPDTGELLALRAGRVLWHGPGDIQHQPVPLGDGVLVRGTADGRGGRQSLLRLLDAETGARAD